MSENNGQQLAVSGITDDESEGAIARRMPEFDPLPEKILKTLATGDIKHLSNEERLEIFLNVCKTTGLSPASKPFDFIEQQGKMTLYANKSAYAQLRKLHGVSVRITEQYEKDGSYYVHAEAEDSDGKRDEDIGIVSLGSLQGQARDNWKMKAMTKAKNRVTLSIVGLGWLDYTEVEDLSPEFYPDRMTGVKREPSAELLEAAERLKSAVVAKYPQFKDHTPMQLVNDKASKHGIDHPTPEMVHGWADEIESKRPVDSAVVEITDEDLDALAEDTP